MNTLVAAMREIWIMFLVPSFGLVQPPLHYLGSKPVNGRVLTFFVYHTGKKKNRLQKFFKIKHLKRKYEV